jgi:hypothetical protein
VSRAGTSVAAVSGLPAVPSRPVTSVQARARVAEGEGRAQAVAYVAEQVKADPAPNSTAMTGRGPAGSHSYGMHCELVEWQLQDHSSHAAPLVSYLALPGTSLTGAPSPARRAMLPRLLLGSRPRSVEVGRAGAS